MQTLKIIVVRVMLLPGAIMACFCFLFSCVMIDTSKPFVIENELNKINKIFVYSCDLCYEKTPKNFLSFFSDLDSLSLKKDFLDGMFKSSSGAITSYLLRDVEELFRNNSQPYESFIMSGTIHLQNIAGTDDRTIGDLPGKVTRLYKNGNTGYAKIQLRIIESAKIGKTIDIVGDRVQYSLEPDHQRSIDEMGIQKSGSYLYVHATGHTYKDHSDTGHTMVQGHRFFGVNVSVGCMDIELHVRLYSEKGESILYRIKSFDNIPLYRDYSINKANFKLLARRLLLHYTRDFLLKRNT